MQFYEVRFTHSHLHMFPSVSSGEIVAQLLHYTARNCTLIKEKPVGQRNEIGVGLIISIEF